MKTQYVLLNFGKTVLKEPVEAGDPITNVLVDGVLREICLLDDLDIPNLDKDQCCND